MPKCIAIRKPPQKPLVATFSVTKPAPPIAKNNVVTKKWVRRLVPKKCTNGHSNHCSAKKCSTCGVPVLSMTRNAVLARRRRVYAKKVATAAKAAPKRRAAKKVVTAAPKRPPFTSEQLKRLGFVVGAQVLYKEPFDGSIVSRTVKKITDGGVDFNQGYVMYPDLLKKTRAKSIFFKDEYGKMTEMSASICYGILEAYCYQKQAKYTYGSHSYTLDWSHSNKGEQTNTSTGVKRVVTLRPIKRKALPNILGPSYPVVDVTALPAAFRNHLASLTCRTKKVYHLEPMMKGGRLLKVMQQIQRERGLSSDTTVLSHGCPMKALHAIVTKQVGFQNVGTSNGKSYGQGLYLSSDINFAAGYSSGNSHGQRVLLMCDVLVGGKEQTGSSTTALSSSSVRSGGSSGHIYMKPWVTLGTDVNIAYAVEFTRDTSTI